MDAVTDCHSFQNSNNLDVEALLRKIIWTHSRSILHSFYAELSAGQWSAVFGRPGEVVLDIDGMFVKIWT